MSQLSLLFVDRAAQLFEIGYIISSADEITEKSIRLPKLQDELDEKTMRWLELSERA